MDKDPDPAPGPPGIREQQEPPSFRPEESCSREVMEKISRLAGYRIEADQPDPVLEKLVRLTAQILDVPICVLTLNGAPAGQPQAAYGIRRKELGEEPHFERCLPAGPHPIRILPDARSHPQAARHPLVTGPCQIRFYAGLQLTAEDCVPFATLGIYDRKPRELTEKQKETFQELADIVTARILAQKYKLDLVTKLEAEKEVFQRLLKTSAELAHEAPSLQQALDAITKNLDPNLGWLSIRSRNMQTGGSTGIHDNPVFPENPELMLIWKKVDSSPGAPGESIKTEFLSAGPLRPSYTFLTVPVRARAQLVALVELIFPDHRKVIPRVIELLEVMAIHLSVVAEKEMQEADLRTQATHDALTGALTRPEIMRGLEKALRTVDIASPQCALIYVDIDGLKELNDNLGHATGDLLLQESVRRMKELCRARDFVGRIGGDEFILLWHDLEIAKELEGMLDRLTRTLSQVFVLRENEVQVPFSIGCAVLSNPETQPMEYVHRAEEAMYQVKRGLRNRFFVADEVFIRQYQLRKGLDQKIREGIRTHRLKLLYQPIIHLGTGAVVGFEALLRLIDHDGSLLSAGAFIKAFSRTRYFSHVDEWVLGEAIQAFRAHSKALERLGKYYFSINVSPPILSARGYAEYCLSQIKDGGVPCAALVMEIVETDLVVSDEVLLTNLHILHEAGIRLAIDDFGTGYSNLQYLTRLPIDIIKIDRVFLGGVDEKDPVKNTLLAAIVDIGKNLKYQMIAEGVETRTQAEHVAKLGCHYGQGFLFGKAMELGEVLALAESRKTGLAPGAA